MRHLLYSKIVYLIFLNKPLIYPAASVTIIIKYMQYAVEDVLLRTR